MMEKQPEITDLEKCEHKETQTFKGAGRSPERTVCVDCKKEL